LQVDLERYFGEFAEVESLRLRRTETGLFKGSVLVQFKSQADAEKYLAEPREWNGSLLEAKTKDDWVKGKQEQNEKLSPEEREFRRREHQRAIKNQKHFSAFKEMDKQKQVEESRSGRNDRKKYQGRRGREGKPRDRSRSPLPVEGESAGENAGKRPRSPSAVEEAPSLFSAKQQKVDDSSDKRPAEEALNGKAKRIKGDE
jgi:lupus La protein